jgi:hypothetical protein
MSTHKRLTTLGLKGLYAAVTTGTTLIDDAQWEQLGVNLEGTFILTQEDTEETPINIEESDNPIVQVLKAGKKGFTTSIPDLAPALAIKLFGATTKVVTVEGQPKTRVVLPDSANYIYMMFKVVPTQGVDQFYYTKGQVSAKIEGTLGKTEVLNLNLTVTALTPDTVESAVEYDTSDGTNSGYILGNEVAETALASLQAISDGSVVLTVDGGTAQTKNDLDFTSADNWADVVDELNSKFTSATWSFDVDEYRMKVASDSTGSTSTVLLSTDTGTDILASSMLNMSGVTPVPGN